MSSGSKLGGAGSAITAKAANLARRGSIAATATVGAVYYYRDNDKDIITARIAGTFVGTIAVQIADPEELANVDTNWVTIASYTAPTSQLISIAADCNLRIYSTAWTSGTATVSLS
jgi:hypothetical protein